MEQGDRTSTGKTFWGDDYVRIPIKFARKYFAENGGNSGDLKLFINDYNLESWWDNNKKVKKFD